MLATGNYLFSVHFDNSVPGEGQIWNPTTTMTAKRELPDLHHSN